LIVGLRQDHKLVDLLQIAGLARSTFYYQCRVGERSQLQDDMRTRIRAIYDEHKGRYGYRRITAALRSSMAQSVNHKCVQRMMQSMGLRALIRAKKRLRLPAGASDAHVPNILERDFSATAPNQKWVTDITEFNVKGHKLYLSACMDLYNGEIISYQMARRPVFELVSETFRTALGRSKSTTELTVHSDQGWQYKMKPLRAMFARLGVTQSMSRKGNCFDNAVIESFFGTLKAEYYHLSTPGSIETIKRGIHDYIHYYNHKRIKLGLQGLSPVKYRLRNTA
jgi:putative transposase